VLPTGDEISHNSSAEDIQKLPLDCKFFANPATDKQLILSSVAKTAAPRQQWIRASHPSITEVMDQYPQMEDTQLDLSIN
jgi:hypothetical protein